MFREASPPDPTPNERGKAWCDIESSGNKGDEKIR
jgi:hypothetical protein